jgi:branched-chain amino acid transport system substrate-binding protein
MMAVLALPLALAAAACSGSGGPGKLGAAAGGTSPAPAIVVGASLPLSGSLAALGAPLAAGYQQEVTDVNAAGGVTVGGHQDKLRLVTLDNHGDPGTASTQAGQLVRADHATALLGSASSLTIAPVAAAAEQFHVPFLTSLMPADAFASGDKSGWTYAWDLFYDQQQQATATARALASAGGDKKVALFTDDEQDSVTERPLEVAAFQAAGLDLVGDYTVADGTAGFAASVAAAKARGAQLVAGQLDPADGAALWKQVKAAGLRPRAAFLATESDAGPWWQALGGLAPGTLSNGYWSPGQAPPGQLTAIAGTLGQRYAARPGYAVAALGYAVAQVLTDALAKAGSTSPAPLNAAIGRTDAPTTAGTVRFDQSAHTALVPCPVTQWQGATDVPVQPGAASVTLRVPVAGLN